MLLAAVLGSFVANPAPAAPPADDELLSLITCVSESSRQHCNADTSSGVVLVRSVGAGECVLRRTWGFDRKGIWVARGCGGEFLLAPYSSMTMAQLNEETVGGFQFAVWMVTPTAVGSEYRRVLVQTGLPTGEFVRARHEP